jgi:phosphoglycolate phosphatase
MDKRLAAIRGILFDKDGTLIDFEKTWYPANRTILRALAKGDDDCLARLEAAAGYDRAAGSFHPDAPVIAGATADFGPLLAAAVPCDYDAEFLAWLDAAAEREGLANTTPIGDPARVCDALSTRGYILGLATNGPCGLAEEHARILGIRDRLVFVCGYDSGYGRKPGPGMVDAFAAATGLAASEIMVVGDTLHDLHMARAAGAFAVGVPSGLTPADILAPDADLMVDDLDALVALF